MPRQPLEDHQLELSNLFFVVSVHHTCRIVASSAYLVVSASSYAATGSLKDPAPHCRSLVQVDTQGIMFCRCDQCHLQSSFTDVPQQDSRKATDVTRALVECALMGPRRGCLANKQHSLIVLTIHLGRFCADILRPLFWPTQEMET